MRQVIVGGIKGEMPAYRKFLSEPEIQTLTACERFEIDSVKKVSNEVP